MSFKLPVLIQAEHRITNMTFYVAGKRNTDERIFSLNKSPYDGEVLTFTEEDDAYDFAESMNEMYGMIWSFSLVSAYGL